MIATGIWMAQDVILELFLMNLELVWKNMANV